MTKIASDYEKGKGFGVVTDGRKGGDEKPNWHRN